MGEGLLTQEILGLPEHKDRRQTQEEGQSQASSRRKEQFGSFPDFKKHTIPSAKETLEVDDAEIRSLCAMHLQLTASAIRMGCSPMDDTRQGSIAASQTRLRKIDNCVQMRND